MQNREFVGRDRELGFLEDAYRGKKSAFIPIYGRRRVGKSELIRRFSSEKPTIYLIGKRMAKEYMIGEFLKTAAMTLGKSILAEISAPDWKSALELVLTEWKSNPEKKLILAFDEFQWTTETSPELPSILQEFWDRDWQHENTVMLILCGSYIGFMEREVLGRKSPLFGRRTGQILLSPFNYREIREFVPNYSLSDQAKAYFLCGGIPLYLKLLNDSESIPQNIADGFLNEYSPFARELDFLLREEFREPMHYQAILMAIGSNLLSNSQISQKTQIPSSKLSYYLNHLLELGYISKKYPLTPHSSSNVKATRYVIEDPLLRFWFALIFPQLSSARIHPKNFMTSWLTPRLDAFFGRAFESLCREAMAFILLEENIQSSFEIGEYWNKEVQIDLVVARQDHLIMIGECKWGHPGPAKNLLQSLEEKAAKYPNQRGETIVRMLFTKTPLKLPETKTAPRSFTLEDLYPSPPSPTRRQSPPSPRAPR